MYEKDSVRLKSYKTILSLIKGTNHKFMCCAILEIFGQGKGVMCHKAINN